MRMTASWSGSNHPTVYKSVARRCTQWRAPLGSSSTQAPTGARSYAKVRLAVHRRCACSGVKARETQASLSGKAAKLCYRFGPLTPSARSANLIAGDGTKNGFPTPNKEPTTNQKSLLDTKSPIQVRIHLPPAKSHVRTDLGGISFVWLGDGLRAAAGRQPALPSFCRRVREGHAIFRDARWSAPSQVDALAWIAYISGAAQIGTVRADPRQGTRAGRAVQTEKADEADNGSIERDRARTGITSVSPLNRAPTRSHR